MAVCVAAVFFFIRRWSSVRTAADAGFLIPRSVGFLSIGGIAVGGAMKGFVGSIEKAALKNKTFRTVLYTAKNCQLVVMSLKPGEDIGGDP